MLTDAELKVLMVDLESELVERKESLSSPDRIREAICAYANDLPGHQRPGVIFIGVQNDGTCANLPITDDLLLRLAQMRDDGAIQPFPSLTVNPARAAWMSGGGRPSPTFLSAASAL